MLDRPGDEKIQPRSFPMFSLLFIYFPPPFFFFFFFSFFLSLFIVPRPIPSWHDTWLFDPACSTQMDHRCCSIRQTSIFIRAWIKKYRMMNLKAKAIWAEAWWCKKKNFKAGSIRKRCTLLFDLICLSVGLTFESTMIVIIIITIVEGGFRRCSNKLWLMWTRLKTWNNKSKRNLSYLFENDNRLILWYGMDIKMNYMGVKIYGE